MKIIIITILLLLFNFPIVAQKTDSKEQYIVYSTSLMSILANPEKYDGKRVRVSGFLHVRFEDNVLYFSKDAADYLIGENGLWIRYAEKPNLQAFPCKEIKESEIELSYFDGRYVLLEGTFNMKQLGHMGANSGTLENVTRVLEQRKWFDGRKNVIEFDDKGRIKQKDCN